MPIQKKLFLTDLGTDTNYGEDRRENSKMYRAEMLGAMHDILKTGDNSKKIILNGPTTLGYNANKNIAQGMFEIFEMLKDENDVSLKIKNAAHSRGSIQSIIRSNDIQKAQDRLNEFERGGGTLDDLSIDELKNLLFGPQTGQRGRTSAYYDEQSGKRSNILHKQCLSYSSEQLLNIAHNIRNIEIDQYLLDPVPGGMVIWWNDPDMHEIPPVVKNCHIRWYQDELSRGFEPAAPGVRNLKQTNYIADTLPGNHGTGSGNLGSQDTPSIVTNNDATPDQVNKWDKREGVYTLVGYQLAQFYMDWSEEEKPFDINYGAENFDENKRPLYEKLTAFMEADTDGKRGLFKAIYQNIFENIGEYREHRKTTYYRGWGARSQRVARHGEDKTAPDNYQQLADIVTCVDEAGKFVNLEHIMLELQGTLFHTGGTIDELIKDIQNTLFEIKRTSEESSEQNLRVSQAMRLDPIQQKVPATQKLLEFKTNRLISTILREGQSFQEVLKKLVIIPESTAPQVFDAELVNSDNDTIMVINNNAEKALKQYPKTFSEQFRNLVTLENTQYIAGINRFLTAVQPNQTPELTDDFARNLLGLDKAMYAYKSWQEVVNHSINDHKDYKEICKQLFDSSKALENQVSPILEKYKWLINKQERIERLDNEIKSLENHVAAMRNQHNAEFTDLENEYEDSVLTLEQRIRELTRVISDKQQMIDQQNKAKTVQDQNIKNLQHTIDEQNQANTVKDQNIENLQYKYNTLVYSGSAGVISGVAAGLLIALVIATSLALPLVLAIGAGVALLTFAVVQVSRRLAAPATIEPAETLARTPERSPSTNSSNTPGNPRSQSPVLFSSAIPTTPDRSSTTQTPDRSSTTPKRTS